MAKAKPKPDGRGGARPGAGRPKTSDRDDVTVRVDRSAVAQARQVAEARGVSLAEYLTGIIAGPVGKDFVGVTASGKQAEGEGSA